MKYDYTLYLVTDRALSLGRDLLEIISAAVSGGVTAVQLREKDCQTREFVALARRVQNYLAPRNIPLFINDRLDVALVVGAQGLHVGQEDMHVRDVRNLSGNKLALGLSVNTIEHCLQAEQLEVDYLGAGPVFSTQTKKDTKQELGLEGLHRIRNCTSIPVVAIGGINSTNALDVIQAGADGIAVVSAICAAKSPEQSAKDLLKKILAARAGKNI